MQEATNITGEHHGASIETETLGRPERPRVRPPYQLVVVDPNHVIFQAGVWSSQSISIRDEKQSGLLARVVTLFDGEHTADEVIRDTGAEHANTILKLIDDLAKSRIVDSAPPPVVANSSEALPAASVCAFLSAISQQSLTTTVSRLREAEIAVVGAGVLGARVAVQLALAGIEHLRVWDERRVSGEDCEVTPWYRSEQVGQPRASALAEQVIGLKPQAHVATSSAQPSEQAWAETLRGCRHAIVALDSVDPILLKNLNAQALQLRVPWTLICMDGLAGIVGPTFIPFETCCYSCYELRLEANMLHYDNYAYYKQAVARNSVRFSTSFVGLAALADILAGFATAECVRILATSYGFTPGKFLRLDFQSGTIETNDVLKLPRCPACGKMAQGQPNELVFDTFERVIKTAGI